MSEWESVFLQSLALPPHGQRRRARPPGSTAFRCVLKYLEGAALAQVRGVVLSEVSEYQLRLSLFDATYHHFFGRTWRTAGSEMPFLSPSPPQTVYFHTSLNHPSITAVVEVVATARKGDGDSRHLSCGFGLIPLFGSGSEATGPAAEDRALKLYHGTPRALLHPRFQDPLEKNKYLTVMEKSHLQYTLKPHPPLETIFHLLPENLLMSGLQTVPGLLPVRGDVGKGSFPFPTACITGPGEAAGPREAAGRAGRALASGNKRCSCIHFAWSP
uniref:Nephrocystin-4 n=1 Tax=Strix occidentalis caurina TaxID=311401 RepID=A0A8D0FAG7_STROC